MQTVFPGRTKFVIMYNYIQAAWLMTLFIALFQPL